MNYYDREEISNSDIGMFLEDASYYHYVKHGDGKTSDTESMDFGRKMHMLIFEPELLEEQYYIEREEVKVPGGMMGRLCQEWVRNPHQEWESLYKKVGYKRDPVSNFREDETQKYIEYLRLVNNKEVISYKDWSLMQQMKTSLMSGIASEWLDDEAWSQAGYEVHNEMEIYWEWEGIKLRSKLDRVYINHSTRRIYMEDYKTTRYRNKQKFIEAAYQDYQYHRAMAFYTDALAYKYPGYLISHMLIVQSKQQPYTHWLCYYDDESLEEGRSVYEEALQEIREREEKNFWGDYNHLLQGATIMHVAKMTEHV